MAGLLRRSGAMPTVVEARNSAHQPVAGVRWRRLLPETFGRRSRLHQVAALGTGLAATLYDRLVRRDVVLVAFTRFPVEDLMLACAARLKRPVVTVVHNPVPREIESWLARKCRRALLAASTVTVVHSDRLRDQVDEIGRNKVRVCPHPPYVDTTVAPVPKLELDPARRWVAFVGALRWDKGIDLVPEVLAQVPAEVRRQMGVVICGRGRVPEGFWQRLTDLDYAVLDLTSANPVPPPDLMLGVLRCRPLVLAPYVAATQSGSVILALTLGCRVLSFDRGGIPDVLSDDGLVPNGDKGAISAALAAWRGGTARVSLNAWEAQAIEAWSKTVSAVSHLKCEDERGRTQCGNERTKTGMSALRPSGNERERML